jgi:serine/threonine protein kinase
MAVVYRGTDLVLERAVAVKVFRASGDVTGVTGATHATDATRYEYEARVLANLNSPGLVTVYDAGVDANGASRTPFLVMEYVPGASLAEVLRDGPLAEPDVARLGWELATALAYVHRHGVVHRDVKPANILLPGPEDGAPADRFDAKLADFGISHLVDGGGITTLNRRLGTVAYLSPEQVRGQGVGPPSDVYSLGLVLAECFAGAPLFPGDGVDAAAARLHRSPQLPPAVPAEWERLLRDMLDLEPARRPTAAEIAVALTGLLTASPAPAAPAGIASGATPGMHATRTEMPLHPTKVLELPPSLLAAPQPPRRVVAARWARRVPWRRVAVAAAALLVFVVVAAAAPSLPMPPTYVRPPAYPSVPGQLGTDLAKLQQQVQR